MFISINPMPCPRPRVAKIGKFVRAYYPKAYDVWREQCREALVPFAGRLTGPLELEVHFSVEQPKTTKLAVPAPDIDNYCKAFMDAGTKAGLWEDDAQVVFLVAKKSWSPKGQPGFIQFFINPENRQ